MKKYGSLGKEAGLESRDVMASLKADIEAFKKAAQGMEV
jgi:hypothetical protein